MDAQLVGVLGRTDAAHLGAPKNAGKVCDLKTNFYGKKRFCSKSCAHAYSASCRKKKAGKREVGAEKVFNCFDFCV